MVEQRKGNGALGVISLRCLTGQETSPSALGMLFVIGRKAEVTKSTGPYGLFPVSHWAVECFATNCPSRELAPWAASSLPDHSLRVCDPLVRDVEPRLLSSGMH